MPKQSEKLVENQKTPIDATKLAEKAILQGVDVIREARKTTPHKPGVYRMIDHQDKVLYVGKAKNLFNRIGSYTHLKSLSDRLIRMISSTCRVEIIITESEIEALLLESSLIKSLKPIYNIVLKDDKSFPFILITEDDDWPRVIKYRGNRSKKGRYFGPFASASAVSQTISTLHRAFPLRSCSDSVFNSRTRPCLEYQIKKCSAPCVGKISSEDYDSIVEDASEFLSGHSKKIQKKLSTLMTEASEKQEYETAGAYRDRIKAITQIQSKQVISLHNLGNIDAIAIDQQAGHSCIQIFFYRSGQSYGNRSYFPSHPEDANASEVLYAFVAQFYSNKTAPNTIILSESIKDSHLLADALSSKSGYAVKLHKPLKGIKWRLLQDANRNAKDALSRHLSAKYSQKIFFEKLGKLLEMREVPRKIEVYDNSHISGQSSVGAMIAVKQNGFEKSSYRKFNIRSDKIDFGEEQISPGDDYGMIHEVIMRRFKRLLRENPDRSSKSWPDLCLIDGGAGQLNIAKQALDTLGINHIHLAAISKGQNRNAGREIIHILNGNSIALPHRDSLLYFVQRIRDEAHRFAVSSYRIRHKNKNTRSILDEISGIGPTRKRALLHHFGSANNVAQAGVKDLEKVDGISTNTALSIYDHFHHQ